MNHILLIGPPSSGKQALVDALIPIDRRLEISHSTKNKHLKSRLAIEDETVEYLVISEATILDEDVRHTLRAYILSGHEITMCFLCQGFPCWLEDLLYSYIIPLRLEGLTKPFH